MIITEKAPKIYTDASCRQKGKYCHIGIGVYELHSGNTTSVKLITTDKTGPTQAEAIALQWAHHWAIHTFDSKALFFFTDAETVSNTAFDFLSNTIALNYVPRECNTVADALSKQAQDLENPIFIRHVTTKVKSTLSSAELKEQPSTFDNIVDTVSYEDRLKIINMLSNTEETRDVFSRICGHPSTLYIKKPTLPANYINLVRCFLKPEECSEFITKLIGQTPRATDAIIKSVFDRAKAKGLITTPKVI